MPRGEAFLAPAAECARPRFTRVSLGALKAAAAASPFVVAIGLEMLSLVTCAYGSAGRPSDGEGTAISMRSAHAAHIAMIHARWLQ